MNEGLLVPAAFKHPEPTANSVGSLMLNITMLFPSYFYLDAKFVL